MKKLIIFTAAITIALSGMSQGKSQGKGHNKNKSEKINTHKSDNRHDDRDDRYESDRDDRHKVGKRHENDKINQSGHNGKYSKNQPAKVRAAFHRDFPNATNVTWTKDRGYWTATFSNGILNTNTVTYAANGQRISGRSPRTNRRTSYSGDGSIWDRILSKQ